MDSTILFQNEVMNGILVDISSTKAIAKRMNFPKDSYWFTVLEESCNTNGFDFGFDHSIIFICVPDINDNTNEVLLSSSMLPYEAGRFVMIFSILEKKDNTFIVKNLELKDQQKLKKELIVRRNKRYLPINW